MEIAKNASHRVLGGGRCFFVGKVFSDVLERTIEDAAKLAECVGGGCWEAAAGGCWRGKSPGTFPEIGRKRKKAGVAAASPVFLCSGGNEVAHPSCGLPKGADM